MQNVHVNPDQNLNIAQSATLAIEEDSPAITSDFVLSFASTEAHE